ncbi:hypothetical protein C9374_008566 [Naegleria lovaniensis]|uniref:C2 domain-containing protein n=1 Tax=Naegleria lovaniensis TaxID=51637 RepID=A0AA88GI60_NAELO|nr:uncharacterized protein C9374_008566 [Naegleria lovaniensis]KAG2377944.1 hypothetical protein C9374_008566 [Naegleria lovaniensis]
MIPQQSFIPQQQQQPMIMHNTDPKQGHILHLKIHSGLNLPKADTLGTIDAYAVVHIPLIVGSPSRATHKSKVIPNNVNPVWKCWIYQHDVDISKNLEIQIFDYDAVGSNDLVATCEIPLSGLSAPIIKKEFSLTMVGKYKPYRSGSPSMITLSMAIGSSHEVVAANLMSRFNPVHKDIFKKNIIFPLRFANLCMKISMKTHLKIKILDCNATRNLVINFEIPGRDFRSKITFHQTPRNVMGYQVFREIKLKKPINLAKAYFPYIKLVTSPFVVVDSSKVVDITRKHGWAGVLDYSAAKRTLKNIIPDDRHESIYMIEQYYYLKCDWDSSNSDQKVGLLDPYRAQGYHVEISHKDKSGSEIEYFASPKRLLDTQHYCGACSEVNDLSYPVIHADMNILLLQKTQPVYYDLFALAPVL